MFSRPTLLTQMPRKRRVFFSFHHQQDIWRVNQVRNSWRYRHESEREAEGFYVGSIWERSKAAGNDSLNPHFSQMGTARGRWGGIAATVGLDCGVRGRM
jgi:MTH538 TIR-like domain (DUF1863)